jgi:hypothetical protein
MLITPRRRVWIRKTPEGIEVGALAKTRDESLPKLVKEITKAMKKKD